MKGAPIWDSMQSLMEQHTILSHYIAYISYKKLGRKNAMCNIKEFKAKIIQKRIVLLVIVAVGLSMLIFGKNLTLYDKG